MAVPFESECTSRFLTCTSFRTQKKRGPKGMKPATARKVQEAQKRLRKQREEQHQLELNTQRQQQQVDQEQDEQQQQPHQQKQSESPNPDGLNHESSSECGSSQNSSLASKDELSPQATPCIQNLGFQFPTGKSQPSILPEQLPLATYCEILTLFDERLYPVWPVVTADALIAKLTADENDYESWALAASLCAATIAQLRLQEHTDIWDVPLSHNFSCTSQRLRELYDYRESYSFSSLLTPFFLHIYFANTGKLRTAGIYLRESITYVHGLSLDQPETYHTLNDRERSFRLRLFWLVFISERTYCAENGFPTVLVPIREMPPVEDRENDKNRITQAFASLTQIFAHLRGDILDASPSCGSTLDPDKIVASQSDLAVERHTLVSSEIQRVDIFELKVYRVADVLMDLLGCTPDAAREHGMWVGLEGILYSLKDLLLDIGGHESVFLDKLQTRMATSEFAVRMWPCLTIAPVCGKDSGRTYTEIESEVKLLD
ncbi:Fc.00g116260.m01.CDS01 [Cosmosporella sp. VM-42]